MNADCFDIGIIQAFLDGELEHAEVSRVSSHVAVCENCSDLLAVAEEESAIVFPALEREFNTLVPTQRLWNKINDSIAIERHNMPLRHKAWVFLRLALLNPSISVAAGVLLMVGIVAVIWVNRVPVADTSFVDVNRDRSVPVPGTIRLAVAPSVDVVTEPQSDGPARFDRAAYRPDTRRLAVTPTVYRTSATTNSEGYMPGLDSYVKTIASLTKTVDTQKDSVMHPSERISYERDMAVVDDAIAKMRNEVKKNPKNESAKQVLYSSYQNKIDLLNSVSQKEELMASLK